MATNGNRCSASAIGRTGTDGIPGLSISANDPLPCPDLSRYGFTVEPYADDRSIDFQHVQVVVVDRVLTDSGTDMELTLDWEGSAYRWFGPLTLVNGC